jgi:hypothetical protein
MDIHLLQEKSYHMNMLTRGQNEKKITMLKKKKSQEKSGEKKGEGKQTKRFYSKSKFLL